MVKVWSNVDCVQCEQTKRFLDKNNIKYSEFMLQDHKEDLQRFLDMGFMSAPIVETDKDTWSGFRLNKLKELAIEEHHDING